MKKKKIFHGWFIALACMLVLGTAVGIVNNCFGLFIVPACEEMGFSRQAMGTTQTMFALGYMIVALFSGAIFKENRLKKLMILGAAVMCGSYALFAVAKSLAVFYIIGLVCCMGKAMVDLVPISLIISNWFNEKRGTAIGLVCAGSGVFGMLFNLLGGRLVESIGWRSTVLVFAAVMCLVILPMVLFVIKVRPEEMGLAPLGRIAEASGTISDDGLTLKEAMRTKAFYLLVLDIIIAGMGVNAIATTSTPFYTDEFQNGVIAANLGAAFMAVLAVGKFSLGGMYDRFGNLKATLISRLLLIFSLLALSGGKNPVFIGIYLLCTGFACATSSTAIPILARNTFGSRDAAAIIGVFSASQSLGAMIAPSGCGFVCDKLGSYAPSYLILAAAVVLMIPSTMMILKTKKKA